MSQQPEPLQWTCATCGPIQPSRMSNGWYVRRRCPCQQAAAERRQGEQIRQALQQQRQAHIYAWLGARWAEQGLAEKTFATFQADRQPRAVLSAQQFVSAPRGTLAFYGAYGTGKTHLLAAIANALGAQGQLCRFASAVSLFDAIGERIGNQRDYSDLLAQARMAPFLLLDDLDKPKASAFRQELCYQILDARSRQQRPLVITSNVMPVQLGPWIGEAAVSRLMAGVIPVCMQGPDYRLEISS